MLRVLVVLPLYGGSLPVGRYAANGLREAGCLVEVFEAPAFYSAFTALEDLRVGAERYEALQNTFLQALSQAVLSKAAAFAPDLVLCLAQAPVSPLALKRLRAEKVPTAMWFVEDYRLFPYWRAFAPLYDLFAVIQKEPFFEQLSAIGVDRVLYLPLAADPSLHRPLRLSAREKKEFGSTFSFMGAGYPNRRRAFREFVGQDFKIWGTEWEEEPLLAPMIQRKGARISPEDTVRIYNAGAINLNLHSSMLAEESAGQGDFVNPRTFELAACQAFQLVDRRSLMAELFSPDELACFDSLPELLAAAAHYKDRPDERRKMAARARKRVLAEHTYAKRMSALLAFAAERLPGFGQRAPVAWPENMPEETRKAVAGLLEELALPADAAFDDLTAALRARNSPLSEVETALLFLEEWKKLYLG
ncbi:MAG: glycosyltransferase [Deltaproteobacteria bacterium]|jgi:spore maturation protein CgeB|nr:glycosyltransferase [Deltaproteobacteria bacterium]